MQTRLTLVFALLAMVVFGGGAKTATAVDEVAQKKYQHAVDKAIAFLGTKAQADDGSFNAATGPAVTALVTTGILRQGRSPEDPKASSAPTAAFTRRKHSTRIMRRALRSCASRKPTATASTTRS
jgi:hypothetical protein